MSKYSSASSLRSAKLETSFGVTNDEPKTHVVIKPGAPVVSLNYSGGMVTPGSISSNQSSSRVRGMRSSMMSDRSFDSSSKGMIGVSGGGGSSRASVRSAGGVSVSSIRHQSQYSHMSDHSHHAAASISSAQGSANDDNVFMTSPEYNVSYHSRHDSSTQGPPRTCPEQGSYTKVSNSCVNLLNNFVAQSQSQPPPPQQNSCMPPPPPSSRYDSSNSSTRYHLNNPNVSLNGAAHRSSANTSASSYDTACSHLSNSVSVGNASNARESAGSFGSDMAVSAAPPSNQVYNSTEQVKWPSPPIEFIRQPSRCSQRENPVFVEPQVPKVQVRAPMHALQESYRMAMDSDRNMPSLTPVGRSLFGRVVRKSESSPSKCRSLLHLVFIYFPLSVQKTFLKL